MSTGTHHDAAGTSLRCPHCGERTPDDLCDTHFSVFARPAPYAIGGFRYPGTTPYGVWCAYTHAHCEPDDDHGYNIRLDRLASDGLYEKGGWIAHLETKNWYDASVGLAIEAAHERALTVRVGAIQRARTEELRVAQRATVAPAAHRDRALAQNARAISSRTRSLVFERDGFRCRRCGLSADDGVPLVIDHVIPVARGGTADPLNLQVLCQPCNAGKRDRLPHPHDMRGRA